jgi:LPXTG-motif cell wall-anchored protein
MTLGLHNPTKDVDITMVFKTTKGETRTVVVKPGETKSEKFSATEGFKVDWTLTATVDGKTESDTISVPFVEGADCSDGEGGGLPVTGAAAGGVAAGAAGLLGVGALLFVMARRRKVKFTA